MNALRDQITIAVTVYSRRQYISQAVNSALNQTVPARVMVVEDCGPDPELESFVRKEFGSRIKYIRNPKRRGLFGNWNACLELCKTEWITILHDDDYLATGLCPSDGGIDGRGTSLPALPWSYRSRSKRTERLVRKSGRTRASSPAIGCRGVCGYFYWTFPFSGPPLPRTHGASIGRLSPHFLHGGRLGDVGPVDGARRRGPIQPRRRF